MAQDLAKKAAQATEDAKAASSKLQVLLAAEKERVHKLELEKSKISTWRSEVKRDHVLGEGA